MSFRQIRESTGISRTTAERQIDKLVDFGLVEIVEKNRKQKGKIERLPRKYRLLMNVDYNINDNDTYISNVNNNDISKCLTCYYTNDELKSTLPRRQYEWLTSSTPKQHKRTKKQT
jgi:DNA-binding Lrp family transcriptional regulator